MNLSKGYSGRKEVEVRENRKKPYVADMRERARAIGEGWGNRPGSCHPGSGAGVRNLDINKCERKATGRF